MKSIAASLSLWTTVLSSLQVTGDHSASCCVVYTVNSAAHELTEAFCETCFFWDCPRLTFQHNEHLVRRLDLGAVVRIERALHVKVRVQKLGRFQRFASLNRQCTTLSTPWRACQDP